MKEGTENSIKFKKLKRRLSLSEWQAIGLLEAIWKLTRVSAQDGAIGRFSNEDIAASIEYDGDADLLVTTLVECGWLDEDPEFRLIVHDWSEHVPTYLKGNFSRLNKRFADQVAKDRAKQGAKQPAKQPAKDGAICNVLPSLTQPNQTQPNQTKILLSADRGRVDDSFEEFWDSFPKTRRTKKQEALRRWKLAVRQADPELLIERARQYAASEQGRSKFAVMPSVWLNAGMWQDEPEAWSRSDSVGGTRNEQVVF